MSESAIFNAAVKLTPEQRAAYLDQACATNQEMRGDIEALLRAHDEVSGFLAGAERTIDQPPIAEQPGSVIGPYELMEQIGEGGFGLVFVAEQHEPVRRKVALKIIKPGMDSGEVIARFEAERQALALMDHPNIARIFDGGATQSGRPYFVMELVKGIPIIEYCDQQQLTARQRLDLFLVVCQAVQHAHGKGIIHRDLKPSNILVAPHDGVPVVKVIDFGVAKAIGQQLTTKKIYTRFTQMIGTPLYMSPEQAEINALDVDIRSDVYSLGVLLYELLTGTTPFDRERFATAAYDEIRRIIKEEEPPKPSTRLSTLGRTLSKVSEKRRTEPGKLSAMVQGDLDWIVMKALEKDRTRRYDTASAFAADVRRFLSDELVEARPPSAWYRFRKMARRNKVALTTAALVAAALLLGTGISAWQAVRATQAEIAALDANVEAVAARDEEARQRELAVLNEDKAKAARDAELLRGKELAVALKKAEQAEQSEKKRAGELAVALKQAKQAKLKAETNELKAEWRLYSSRVASVQKEWETGNFAPRNQQKGGGGGPGNTSSLFNHYLTLARRDFRGWEHDYLYSLANQYQLILPVPVEQAEDLAFSPDGTRLAIASGQFAPNPKVKILEVASGRVVLTIKGAWGPLAFSPDGKRLAGGTESDTVSVWEAVSGKKIMTLQGHANARSVYSMAFDPDGGRLATASLGEAKLWDIASGKAVRTFKHREDGKGRVNIALSPDGRYMASAYGNVKVWEVASGKEIMALEGPNSIFEVVFSPDGKRLAATSAIVSYLQPELIGPRTVKVWELADGREVFNLKGAVIHLAFSSDSKQLAGATVQGTVKVWDLAGGQELLTLKGPTGFIAFTSDGKRLASMSSDGVKIWDLANSEDCLTLTVHKNASKAGPGGFFLPSLAFSPDGKHLAGKSSDMDTVKLWDAANGREIRTFTGHTGQVMSVAFSPNGKVLASASADKTVKLWDPASGKEFRTITGFASGVNNVAFSPDGTYLASAEHDYTKGSKPKVKVWEFATGKQVLTVDDTGGRALAFSPDGKSLATIHKGELKVLDVASGGEIMTGQGHTDGFPCVAFIPDGKRLVSAFGDQTVMIWDLASGEKLLTLSGHTNIVRTVAVSPDGKRLATGSADNTVKIWDAASGQELLTLTGHTGGIPCVIFSPDGKRLASSCNDGTIKIWDASKSMKELEQK